MSQIAGFIDCDQHSFMDFSVISLLCLAELKLSGTMDMESFGRHSLGLLLELKGLKAWNN